MQGQEPQLPKLTKRQAISACPEALQSHLEGDHQSLQTRYAGMCDHLQPHYHEQVLDFPPKNGEVQPTLAGVGENDCSFCGNPCQSAYSALCLQRLPQPSHVIPPHPQAGGEEKSSSPGADGADAQSRHFKGQHLFSQAS